MRNAGLSLHYAPICLTDASPPVSRIRFTNVREDRTTKDMSQGRPTAPLRQKAGPAVWGKKMYRATHCARNDPLPLLPSGPGGVGGITSRRTRHTSHSNILVPSKTHSCTPQPEGYT